MGVSNRLLQDPQGNETTLSVSISRNILRNMSVNTGLQMDKTVNILLMKVSTDIPHITKRLLNETGMIWMQ